MSVLRPSLARSLGLTTLALFVAGLLFRFAVYGHMYLHPGDPYGISDLIEFVLGWAFIGAFSISVIAALVLVVRGPRANRLAGCWLALVCVAVAVLVIPLHNLAARWAI